MDPVGPPTATSLPKPRGYGTCPKCGAPVDSRERRPNGNDRCEAGHVFPSRETVPYEDEDGVDEFTGNEWSPQARLAALAARKAHALARTQAGLYRQGDLKPLNYSSRADAGSSKADTASTEADTKRGLHGRAASAHRHAAEQHRTAAAEQRAAGNYDLARAHTEAANGHDAAAEEHREKSRKTKAGTARTAAAQSRMRSARQPRPSKTRNVANHGGCGSCCSSCAAGKPCAGSPSAEDEELGADAAEQRRRTGHNPASWVRDERIWEKAKAAVSREKYDEDAYWAVVTKVYKNMGGRVGKATANEAEVDGSEDWEPLGNFDVSQLRDSLGRFTDIVGGAHELATRPFRKFRAKVGEKLDAAEAGVEDAIAHPFRTAKKVGRGAKRVGRRFADLVSKARPTANDWVPLANGGPGSGHWGHSGRPGKRGGSAPAGGSGGQPSPLHPRETGTGAGHLPGRSYDEDTTTTDVPLGEGEGFFDDPPTLTDRVKSFGRKVGDAAERFQRGVDDVVDYGMHAVGRGLGFYDVPGAKKEEESGPGAWESLKTVGRGAASRVRGATEAAGAAIEGGLDRAAESIRATVGAGARKAGGYFRDTWKALTFDPKDAVLGRHEPAHSPQGSGRTLPAPGYLKDEDALPGSRKGAGYAYEATTASRRALGTSRPEEGPLTKGVKKLLGRAREGTAAAHAATGRANETEAATDHDAAAAAHREVAKTHERVAAKYDHDDATAKERHLAALHREAGAAARRAADYHFGRMSGTVDNAAEGGGDNCGTGAGGFKKGNTCGAGGSDTSPAGRKASAAAAAFAAGEAAARWAAGRKPVEADEPEDGGPDESEETEPPTKDPFEILRRRSTAAAHKSRSAVRSTPGHPALAADLEEARQNLAGINIAARAAAKGDRRAIASLAGLHDDAARAFAELAKGVGDEDLADAHREAAAEHRKLGKTYRLFDKRLSKAMKRRGGNVVMVEQPDEGWISINGRAH